MYKLKKFSHMQFCNIYLHKEIAQLLSLSKCVQFIKLCKCGYSFCQWLPLDVGTCLLGYLTFFSISANSLLVLMATILNLLLLSSISFLAASDWLSCSCRADNFSDVSSCVKQTWRRSGISFRIQETHSIKPFMHKVTLAFIIFFWIRNR